MVEALRPDDGASGTDELSAPGLVDFGITSAAPSELESLRGRVGEIEERLRRLESAAAPGPPVRTDDARPFSISPRIASSGGSKAARVDSADSRGDSRLLVLQLQARLHAESAARRYWEDRAQALLRSTSWRVTAPIRWIADRLHGYPRDAHTFAPVGNPGESLTPNPFSLDRPALVDVIVCVKDQLQVVRPCIESVVRFSTVPIRLIVVDDASRAETRNYLESLTFPHLSLHRNPRTLGYTCSANLGLAAGTSPYRVLLNSDTVVTRGWLERLLRCMNSSPSTAIVGPLSNRATYQSVPRVTDRGGWAPNPLDVELQLWSEAVAACSQRRYPEVPNVSGMCWMVRASALEQVGLFDEEFSPEGYGEENEFARRAEAAGYTCRVADDAFVFHHGGSSFGARRARLEALAHQRYTTRFGAAGVQEQERRLRENPVLDRVRERLLALTEGDARPAVLYLLPNLGWFGGVILVLETVRCLRRLGLDVAIAVPASQRSAAHPRDADSLRFYRGAGELQRLASAYDAVVATHHDTVPLQEKILERHPHLVPFYFVQDYEPSFYAAGTPMHAAARRSYGSVRGNHLYSISDWVAARVAREHGLAVSKVPGGIDLEIYDPCRSFAIEEGKLKIAAMIRPSTPWRAPHQTLEAFEALADRYPGRLRFVTFGCSAAELAALSPAIELEHHGVAAPEWIFALLRNVDVFVDLSEHQAYGRTALEAMAAGCVVLVPEEGGCGDYARHRENALVCDTSDGDTVVALLGEVIEDAGLRDRLRRAAVSTALDKGAVACAIAQYDLFRQGIERARVGQEPFVPAALALDAVAEEAARTALAAHLAASGERDVALHVRQKMDVDAALGRFAYLRSAVPPAYLPPGAAILVSGFAAGSEMIAARRAGFGEVHGVEVDRELVAISAARLAGLDEMYPVYYEGDRLPYRDASFALVASGHVIEHTADPQIYLGECMRVLETGGLLSLEFPSRFHPTELHTRQPSLEWMPRPLRNLGLRWLTSGWSPLGAERKRRYASIVDSGLQQISLAGVRRMLARTGFGFRLLHECKPAPGIVRCVFEKREPAVPEAPAPQDRSSPARAW